MAVARDERTKQVVKTAATAASLAVVGELSRRLSQQPGVRAGVAAQLLKRVSDDRGDARTKRALAEPVSGSDSDSSPEEVVAGDSAWSAPAWLPPKSSEPDTRVIGAPLEFYMTKAELQRVEKHPRIPSLYIEATRVDPAGPALAIDWEPVVNPRVFYSVQQIPRAWTAVRHDEHLVPMELRSDESGHIWCRWLEPSLTDRQIQRENPYVPMDPAVVERRIREGLRAAAKSTPRWHV